MKKWNSIIEYYSDCEHKFVDHVFEIDDSIYNRIQDLIKNGVLLKNDEIYDELFELAETSFKQGIKVSVGYLYIKNIIIDDPTELNKFKKAIVGKRYGNDGNIGEVVAEYDYVGDKSVENEVVFIIDGNHIIRDVKSIHAHIVFSEDAENTEKCEKMPYSPSYKQIIDDITEDNEPIDDRY